MNEKKRVLFVCIHNSARSQMCEAFLNLYGSEKFVAESAGIEKGNLNPYVVEVLKEKGIDISGKSTNSVFDYAAQNRIYDYIITVCDKEAADRCPYFPGKAIRLHWYFKDPSKLSGNENEILKSTRSIRDEIEIAVRVFLHDN